MKLGGVCSGIGGFEEAWRRNGGEVAWLCEIEPAARKVLEALFPGVPVYPDITELDPDEVEPVDVLTGGTPCQGFSIAGGRRGMEHAESRLFADYVRILDRLAERGLSWAVWENVPGVLSITNDDGERTFPHVVAALAGAREPVWLNEGVRWNTGMAARGSRAVSWRVLDSRHFGVPQRRRRVYACVALGGAAERRAFGALLALPEGVRGDTAACSQTGQAASAGAGAGAASSFDARQSDVIQYGDDAGPLDTDGHSIAVLMTMREGKDGGGKGPLLSEDESLTLATGNGQVLFEPQPEAYGVRRLTPQECEALQGFPDGWTEPAGSDSARYRALGNAVTVNVPQWLFGRMLEADDD